MSDGLRTFKFFNGVRDVYGDPLRLHRRLYAAFDGDPDAAVRAANAKDPAAAFAARERLVAGVRDVFELPSFDDTNGQGATEEDCEKVLADFLDYLEKKSRSGGSPPNCSPSTTSPSPTSSALGSDPLAPAPPSASP